MAIRTRPRCGRGPRLAPRARAPPQRTAQPRRMRRPRRCRGFRPIPPRAGFGSWSEQAAVTVAATGEPAVLTVRVTNTSSIVDGYAVEAPEAPGWLTVEADDVQLLPGTEETLSVRMRVVSPTLVPAQQIRLVLSIRSTSQAPAHLDLPVLVTVPVLDVPVGLRAEPRLLRVRDRDTAACTVLVDNSRSNRPARIRLSGSDPEQAVQFHFEPATLEVGPGESGSVQLTVTAAGPDPGPGDLARPDRGGHRRRPYRRDTDHAPAGENGPGAGPPGDAGSRTEPGAGARHHRRAGPGRGRQPRRHRVGAPGAQGQRSRTAGAGDLGSSAVARAAGPDGAGRSPVRGAAAGRRHRGEPHGDRERG